MSIICTGSKHKPRKESKRQREVRLRLEIEEKERKKRRKEYIKTAPDFVPKYNTESLMPQRGTGKEVKDTHEKVKPEVQSKVEYTGEMAERERIAQEELERKKKQTAPLYNKGPVQYIDDIPEIIRDLGKKV